MSNRVREACPGHDDEASQCEDCIDIPTRMLFQKALRGTPDPKDTQRKVIRKIIALAEKEGLSQATALQLGPHFFEEYREFHETDNVEEWARFEKSQQCRAMMGILSKHFTTRSTTPDREPPQVGQGTGFHRSLTRVMTSIERLGTWANGKDDPRSFRKSSGWKVNGIFGSSSSSKASISHWPEQGTTADIPHKSGSFRYGQNQNHTVKELFVIKEFTSE
ncbi:hypothetical protein PISL3812_08669 [Talaromyces islandicus]|uniref:Uncharacterized protein n=1 Tax=Talaromyces islandicus TaxID=28573 RepID=A0A0U1M7R1_TALIS|nr:hypothetical protein PISL3812_08669 [Talaromyces islandicus]